MKMATFSDNLASIKNPMASDNQTASDNPTSCDNPKSNKYPASGDNLTSTDDPAVSAHMENLKIDPAIGQVVWTRAVFNNEVATKVFAIEAKYATRWWDLLDALDENLGIINWDKKTGDEWTFQGRLFAVASIVLDEKGTAASHAMQHKRFSAIEHNQNFKWSYWVQRNIGSDQNTELRAEVHFFLMDDDDYLIQKMEEMDAFAGQLTKAGKGLAELKISPYFRLKSATFRSH